MLKLSLLHTTQQHTTPTGPHEMHATPHDKGLHVTHTHTHPLQSKRHIIEERFLHSEIKVGSEIIKKNRLAIHLKHFTHSIITKST